MNGHQARISTVGVVVLALLAGLSGSGCNEVRGRRKIQEGNKFYKDGMYKEAVAAFEEAEQMVPHLPVLWLNKGFTCRQMVIPGSKLPESVAGAKCAITAFLKYQEMAPQDSRGEMLYVQTLFDSDEFETLSKMYEGRFQKDNKDSDAVTGLIQVYTKWNKLEEALEWYSKKAEIHASDPEAQYSVGVFMWQQLMQKGGGPDKASFDPRPDPSKPKLKKVAPQFAYGDIVSQQRIDLADTGIKFLVKATELRPKYHEAMIYANLLYRQQSFAYFDQPDEWQKCIDKARDWHRKSLEAQGKPIPANLLETAPIITKPVNEDEDAAAEDAAVPAGKATPGKKAGKKAGGKGKRGGRK
jgi:tetratricopeptide (TPR) repeat protein